jgi:serine/threonine protein phosphatase 1
VIETQWGGGTVVFLGDYVDRGPQSRGVLERLMAGPKMSGWRWIALKGNHEEIMVAASRGCSTAPPWHMLGGEQTLRSFDGSIPDAILDWADRLPLLHVDAHRIFVHAGIDEAVALEAQSPRTLLWKRPIPGVIEDFGGRHLVHGHTPLDENPRTTGSRTNIDTGCVFGGRLTAAVFEDQRPGPPVRFLSIASGAAR